MISKSQALKGKGNILALSRFLGSALIHGKSPFFYQATFVWELQSATCNEFDNFQIMN